jgi:two-component system, chemotaxis family, response regulator Rcp1
MATHVHILLVDDNPGDLELMREALGECGILADTASATTAAQALALLTALNLPDLILSDMSLPGLGGKELLRFIKSDPRTSHIPAIILSGSASPADVSDCYRLGANEVLEKPRDWPELVALFTSVSRRWIKRARPSSKLPRSARRSPFSGFKTPNRVIAD